MADWGNAGKGAASGALAGSALGPWGALAGGAIGGLYGLFGGGGDAPKVQQAPQTADYQRSYLQNMLSHGAPMMNTAQSDQARGQQSQLAAMLMQQATGQRQGAGELAVQRQTNNALAQQSSLAQQARGANAALALRNAARSSADIGTNAAGQASIAQLQDQASAQNQLAGLLGTQRSQDIQTAGANQQAQLGQQNIQLGALAQLLGVDQAALGQSNMQTSLDLAEKRRQDAQMASMMQAAGQAAATYAAGQPKQQG